MKPKPLTFELRGFDQLTQDWQRCHYGALNEAFYLYRGEIEEIAYSLKSEVKILRRIRLEFAENKREHQKCLKIEELCHKYSSL